MRQTEQTSWDVAVLNANDLSILTYIPRWRSIEISDQLNDVGFGRVEHTISDSFFSDFETTYGESLFNGNYAIGIYRDSQRIFSFLIEESETQGTLPDEKVTFSGRGIACTLEWAITLPEDYARKKKKVDGKKVTEPTFQRDFLSYKIVADLATTTNLVGTYANGTINADAPGAGATLTASSNGALTIDGIAAQIGDTILVKNQTTTSRNGLYTVDASGSVSTPWKLTRHGDYDGLVIKDLAINRQFYVIYGNTNAGTAWYKSNAQPASSADVGTTAITFAQLSASNTGLTAFWILYKEATTGYEYSTKFATYAKQVKGTNTGRKGNAVDFPITLESTINTQKGMQDSNGSIVRDGGFFDVQVGDNLLKVLGQISDQCLLDWHVDGDGVLKITNKPIELSSSVHGSDKTTGGDTKLFTLPMMESVTSQVSLKSLKTIAYGSDQNNMSHLRASTSIIDKYGTREGFFENSAANAPAIRHIATSALRKAQQPETQVTARTLEYEGHVAWLNIDIGDKVLVETSTGTFVERVVSAMSVKVTESGQDTEFTFDNVIQDIVKKVNFRTIYGTDNADVIKGFRRRGNGAKKQPTVTNSNSGVVGLSNRVTVSWEAPTEGNPSQYEVIAYRAGSSFNISAISRSSDIATFTTTSAHGLAVNDRVLIRDVAYNRTTPSSTVDTEPLDEYNEYGLVVFAVPTTTTFRIAITGDDESLSWSSNYGTVREILEEHKKIVPGDARTTVIENLASPGSTYQTIIRPMNEFGQAGEISDVATFTASTDPLTLIGGTIQSSNYVAGSAGWSINSNGNAEFSDGTFRGALTGATIDIGGNDSTSFHVDIDGNLWSGAGTLSSAQFRVYNTGFLEIGGSDATSIHVAKDGNFWGGGTRRTITNIAGNATTLRCTVTFSSSHSFKVGDYVAVEIITTGYEQFNDVYAEIMSVTSTTLTYYCPTATNLSTTAVTGYAFYRPRFALGVNNIGDSLLALRFGNDEALLDNVGLRLRDLFPAEIDPLNPTWNSPETQIYQGSIALYAHADPALSVQSSWLAEQFEGYEGTASAPFYSFSNDQNTGIYSESANRISFSTDGTNRGFIGTNQIELSLPIRLPNGTAAAPSYSFQNATDSGMRATASSLFLGLNGNNVFAATSTTLTCSIAGSTAFYADTATFYTRIPQNASTTTVRWLSIGGGLYALTQQTSLREQKENIIDIDDALATINQLRPRQFTWKPKETDTELKKELTQLDINYGFVVEEVLDVDKKLIEFDCKNDEDWDDLNKWKPVMWKEQYINVLSVRAIQQLNEKIEALEARIVELGG